MDQQQTPAPLKIGVFDLMSFFWTIAGARSKDEGAIGLALQVLRYMREAGARAGLDAVLFGADGPAGGRSWRSRVDPAYKSQRSPKDEAQREELTALTAAICEGGFTVVQEPEKRGAGRGCASLETVPGSLWFEGEDCVASLAAKVLASGNKALIFSNDWDLAQLLRAQVKAGPPTVAPLLFTTRGDERTADDAFKEFGVPPEKLCDLLALAGDPTDGFKPFPGAEKGKPGIGDKTAKDLVLAFGSARAAMAAALAEPPVGFEKFTPRIVALLRAGGEAALERGLLCATIRADVPVPDDVEVGDWEEAESLLLMRQTEQSKRAEQDREEDAERARRSASKDRAPALVAREGTAHDPEDHGGTPRDDGPEDESAEPAGFFRTLGGAVAAPEDEGVPLADVNLRAPTICITVDVEKAKATEVLTPEPNPLTEHLAAEADRAHDDLTGKLAHARGDLVLLTAEEWLTLAPVFFALEWLALPEEAREAVLAASHAARGARPMTGGVFACHASERALEGFRRFADASRLNLGGEVSFEFGRDAAERLHAAATKSALAPYSLVGFADFGRPFARVR